MQVKLLRAIQERAVRPVGATQEVPVDVRLVSASHKDLAQEVQGQIRYECIAPLPYLWLAACSGRTRAIQPSRAAHHRRSSVAVRARTPPTGDADHALAGP